MQLSIKTLLALATSGALMISSTHAGPIHVERASDSDELITLFSKEIVVDGVAGVWEILRNTTIPEDNSVDDITPEEAEALSKRCGSNQIHCDYTANRARSSLCGILLDILGAPENVDRSITPYTNQCFTATDISDNNRCCISWQRAVSGSKIRNLFGAASPSLSQCTSNGLVSAWASDVNLAGQCMNQCLSNQSVC